MLETLLHQQMKQQGSIRLDHFINQALYHEKYGYYRTRIPVGKENDFITSPEICSVFGELIGLFLLDYWQKCNCPSPIRLVELGPGSGTMMVDILKSFRLRPTIFHDLTVHLVELSQPLKESQQKKLQAYPFVTWHQHLDEISDGFQLIIANEFFDAFPIRQFRYDKMWTERFVTASETGFCFTEKPLTTPPVHFTPSSLTLVETSPATLEYVDHIACKIKKQGGLGLFIDYGAAQAPWVGDSLQAMKNHQYVDIFEDVGNADITHHVDFLTIQQQFSRHQLEATNLLSQRDFLLGLGIEQRLQQQEKHLSPEELTILKLAVSRLINPQLMGELFKVLIVTSSHIETIKSIK